LDQIDRAILRILQVDATLPIATVAERVGLSQTPCWKRIRKLEAAGVITRRVALVDPEKAGLGLTAFIAVTAVEHSPTWRVAFAEAMATLPEVLEVWRMAGEADYLLKVVVRDMAAYDAFYHRLTGALELKAVSSQFAMERVAYSTALPIPDGES
jgi:Lrp/AsnC family transcriptional regulator